MNSEDSPQKRRTSERVRARKREQADDIHMQTTNAVFVDLAPIPDDTKRPSQGVETTSSSSTRVTSSFFTKWRIIGAFCLGIPLLYLATATLTTTHALVL